MVDKGFALPDGEGISRGQTLAAYRHSRYARIPNQLPNASNLTCDHQVRHIGGGNMLAAMVAERHGVQTRK